MRTNEEDFVEIRRLVRKAKIYLSGEDYTDAAFELGVINEICNYNIPRDLEDDC